MQVICLNYWKQDIFYLSAKLKINFILRLTKSNVLNLLFDLFTL